jgi:hypothetical protein
MILYIHKLLVSNKNNFHVITFSKINMSDFFKINNCILTLIYHYSQHYIIILNIELGFK